MNIEADGKVQVYLVDRETGEPTGETAKVWPVDARELVDLGDAVLEVDASEPDAGEGE